MFQKLFLFEWKYQLRKPTFIIFSTLFFIMGFYFCAQEGAINLSNPYHIHLFTSLISLCVIFQIMFQMSSTMLRDIDNNTTEIIHSTAVSKFRFLMSRYVGVFFTSSISTFLYILGLYTCAIINFGGIHENESFSFYHFLWPWVFIVLPNVLFASSVLFGMVIISKSSILTFTGGVVLLAIFWINNLYIGSPFTGGNIVVSPEIMNTISLTDPFGLCASYEQVRFWTPNEKETKLVSATGSLLINRIIWGFFSFIVLFITYRVFSFRLKIKEHGKPYFLRFKKIHLYRKKENTNQRPKYIPTTIDNKSFKLRIKSYFSLVKIDFKGTLYDKKFITLLLIWCVMLFLAISHNINGQEIYGSTYPTSGLVSSIILEPLSYLGLLIVIFYSGELVWKSRQFNFNEILDATPISNNLLLTSKFSVLFLLPILLITLGIGIGIIFQLITGYHDFNWEVYLKTYYFGGLSLIIFTILSVFVQTLASNKYLGMLASIIFIYALGFLLPMLGLNHPILSLFQLPKIPSAYSDLAGYSQITKIFNSFSLLWCSLICIVLILSYKGFKRNAEHNFKDQFSNIFKNWSLKEKLALLFFSGLSLTFASRIVLIMIITGANFSDEDIYKFSENYERKYKKYKDLNVPEVIDIKTNIDISPDELKYNVNGIYLLKNTSEKNIETILITAPNPLDQIEIESATLLDKDLSMFEVRLYKLDSPLKPNDTVQLKYEVNRSISGFETNLDIVSNGTYLRNSSFEPKLGYIQDLEIKDHEQRRKRDLPIKAKEQNSLGAHAFNRKKRQKLNFETILSTSSEQIALAPGKLINKSIKKKKSYYHYKSNEKIDNTISYFSANYKIFKAEYKGVKIEVYHHPEHNRSLQEIMRAIKATLDYGTKNFGPYPFEHLKIAEVPLHWKFAGHALPGVIALHENFYTQNSKESHGKIDQLSKVVAHEIAHQWFGHKLSPRPEKGANFLSESIANYVEAQVIEKLHGKAMVRKLADLNIRRYFKSRSDAKYPEPPLFLVGNQTYVAYRKGFVVMQSIKDLIGEEKLNMVLSNMIKNHGDEQSITTKDFLNLLYKTSPQNEHVLINDLMKKRITYDLKIDSVSHKKLKDSSFRITARIIAKRFNTNIIAKDIPIDINEQIEIGFFSKHPSYIKDYNKQVISKPYLINKEETIITIASDSLPEYIAIDPFLRRLDKNRIDNIKILKSDK